MFRNIREAVSPGYYFSVVAVIQKPETLTTSLMHGSYKQKTIRFAYSRLLLTFNVWGLCQKTTIRNCKTRALTSGYCITQLLGIGDQMGSLPCKVLVHSCIH